jgi:LysW-gamma-L-lysine carboxypeptidase
MTEPDVRSPDYPGWLLAHMVAIPSPSGVEGELAEFAAGELARLGLTARVDEVGNLVAENGFTGGPTILMLGHLDTVPVSVPPKRVGSLVYGRGAVDAKGPLAAMMLAAAASADLPARIVVAGVVGEEVAGSVGARHVVATLPRPDAVIIGEPSGWNGVCLGYKGRVGVTYEVTRPASHTSSPYDRAVELATDFWRHLSTSMSTVDGSVAALTRLTGDIERARAEITCRVPAGFDFAAFEADLVAAAAGGLVTLDERVPAVVRTRRDPVVRALVGGIRSQDGEVSLKAKAGTSDMNVLAEHWPVPMAAYGPGDAHLDHTDEEHLDTGDLRKAVRVLRSALRTLSVGFEKTLD